MKNKMVIFVRFNEMIWVIVDCWWWWWNGLNDVIVIVNFGGRRKMLKFSWERGVINEEIGEKLLKNWYFKVV